MNHRIPPKIAVINSFAGYGRCSLTEALPILSAMKVQACPVPTAVLSSHLGLPAPCSADFTGHMSGYLGQWDRLGLTFDGICCGFLGSAEQIPILTAFLSAQRRKGCPMILVDPVMGDHGRVYRTVTLEHCNALKELAALADTLTPNLTEACQLTGIPYKEQGWNSGELESLCRALHAMGPKKVAVTGLLWEDGLFGQTERHADGSFLNLVSEQAPDGTVRTTPIVTPSAGPSRHGTGDIFAAILAADGVNGVPFAASVKKAADFIAACIRLSEELQIPECEGVCFENLLDTLA